MDAQEATRQAHPHPPCAARLPGRAGANRWQPPRLVEGHAPKCCLIAFIYMDGRALLGHSPLKSGILGACLVPAPFAVF